ncbi:CBS domain-containing protein [Nitrosopumilus sp.]|uniref:CBS domain-containing protein n=1 Tax=Nitrosopumilus sp. TaxID=2024843 RepID=UPI003B5AA306
MNSTFVHQVMNKNLIFVDNSTSIQDAAKKMTDEGIGCVIVKNDGKSVGILTERDFVTKVASEGLPLFTDVSEIMSSPLITIPYDDTIWEASEIMKSKKIHKLPVIEKDNVVGIITTSDIIRISSLGSDSQMRKICDDILLRISKSPSG